MNRQQRRAKARRKPDKPKPASRADMVNLAYDVVLLFALSMCCQWGQPLQGFAARAATDLGGFFFAGFCGFTGFAQCRLRRSSACSCRTSSRRASSSSGAACMSHSNRALYASDGLVWLRSHLLTAFCVVPTWEEDET